MPKIKYKNCSLSTLLGIAVSMFAVSCAGPVDEITPSRSAQLSTDSVAELRQIAYIKASNTGGGDNFGAGGNISGDAVVLSKDGGTLAVGAPFESSSSSGVGGNQVDKSLYGSGAVYIFTRQGDNWVQQAYLKASNPGLMDNFGFVTALSGSGNTLAVSAYSESSGDAGVEADQSDNSIPQAGAVYIFTRTGDSWDQQAYIKSSNIGERGFGDGDQFGAALTLSDDGNVLAVSAITEDGGSPGIDGDEMDNSKPDAGAVYLFQRNGNTWAQSAYVKASNPSDGDLFGYSVSLSADGRRLAVGSYDEDGSLAGSNEQQDDELDESGAVYVFDYSGEVWNQTAYLKASNAGSGDALGVAVAISGDGNTLVATAADEDGMVTGVNGIQDQTVSVDAADSNIAAGAIYVFVHTNGSWSQQAYVKASNTGVNDWFGSRVALSGDGNILAAGAQLEDSAAQGIDGIQDDDTATAAGAVYLFARTEGAWSQIAYMKGSNTEAFDEFGSSISLSRDGSLIAIGAQYEDSASVGLSGNQTDNSGFDSGAVYLFSH